MKRLSAKLAISAAEYAAGAASPRGYAAKMNHIEAGDADWLAAARGEAAGMAVVAAWCGAAAAAEMASVAKWAELEEIEDAAISAITDGLDYESVWELAARVWAAFDGGSLAHLMGVDIVAGVLTTTAGADRTSTWAGDGWGPVNVRGDHSPHNKWGNMGGQN